MKAVHVDFEDVLVDVGKRLQHLADEEGICGRADGEGQEADVGKDSSCPFFFFSGVEGDAFEELGARGVSVWGAGLGGNVDGEEA